MTALAVSLFSDRRSLRLVAAPPLTTIAGSALILTPAPSTLPILPAAGLLMLLGWRLLRPELWPAWVGLPLGLIDDLVSGAPLGQSALFWTMALLAVDAADHRLPWRDHMTDWLLAAAAIAACAGGAWLLALPPAAHPPLWTIALPVLAGMLAFPAAVRLCAMLDRWRLRR